MRALSVVGARPNFVKIASLLRAMRAFPQIESTLVHTGQHYDARMSAAFFRELEIPDPDINLGVGSRVAVGQVYEIMGRLKPVLLRVKPDVVLVVGDVNSTLAGALAAAELRIPLAHVEAGLRSFDRSMPEEINRIITDSIADFLFASEPSGVANLLREGRPAGQVFLAGNAMIDTLLHCLPSARRSVLLSALGLSDARRGPSPPARYCVATLHRPSTVDDPPTLRATCQALEEIARQIPVVFPVHPRTQGRLTDAGLALSNGHCQSPRARGIRLVPPLSYLQFLHLESQATFVVTDSGGVQEETTALGVPCLTVRENTERPITVTQGTNTLVGLDAGRLVEEARKVIAGGGKRGRTPALWDGRASERIVTILARHFGASRVMVETMPIEASSNQLAPVPSA